MSELRQSIRYPLTVQRQCSLSLIIFKDLSWADHTANLKDIGRDGVGIESQQRIDQGFVWFHDRVGGFRGGVLVWSMQQGSNFRAGIQFVPLSLSQENDIEDEVSLMREHAPLRNPEALIATIRDSLAQKKTDPPANRQSPSFCSPRLFVPGLLKKPPMA